MKKQLPFPLTLAALMAAGGGLRLWQRRTAFEPDTGLLRPGAPATWCVVALALAAAGALFFLSRRGTEEGAKAGYLRAFSLPGRGMIGLYVLAGALLAAAGALGLWRRRMGLDGDLGRLALSVGLFPAGACVGLVGWLNGQRAEARGRFAWPLLVPGYCGCLWLVCAYQSHTGNPNEMEYIFYFLGAVCAVSCCYIMASFSFEKCRPTACLWLGGMSLVFLTMSAVDFWETGARPELLVSLGYGLYLAAQMACLLWRSAVPAELEPWTPPDEEEEKTQAEAEVTDHE